MRQEFQKFLDGGYKYNFQSGPETVRSREQALSEGLNCIALMHILIHELLGVTLPTYLRAWEMFQENPYMKDVASQKMMNLGDIIFFGERELPSYARNYKPVYDESKLLINESEGKLVFGERYAGVHIAMNTGEVSATGQPLVIHANKIAGGVALWPLKQFSEYRQYEQIHGIKRVAAYRL